MMVVSCSVRKPIMRCCLKLCRERGDLFAAHCRERIRSICGIPSAGMSLGDVNTSFSLLSKGFVAQATTASIPTRSPVPLIRCILKQRFFHQSYQAQSVSLSFETDIVLQAGVWVLAAKSIIVIKRKNLNCVCSNVKTGQSCYLQITALSSSCDTEMILFLYRCFFIVCTRLYCEYVFLQNLTEQQLGCRKCGF